VSHASILSVLPGFLLAVLALAMLPGPATALLIRESIAGNRRSVIGVMAGIEVGIFAWALGAATGVAALVTASRTAYTGLRIVGATVLVVLGLQTLWYARRRRNADDAHEAPRPLVRITGFRGGLLTNLANPKAAVFAFSFYPQFVPNGANVVASCLLLGLVHVLVDVAWYTVLTFAVSRARRIFERAALRRRLEQLVGTVMVALGLRLALEPR
jgi:threonine/homoserine/homoserine lactone efflux protein